MTSDVQRAVADVVAAAEALHQAEAFAALESCHGLAYRPLDPQATVYGAALDGVYLGQVHPELPNAPCYWARAVTASGESLPRRYPTVRAAANALRRVYLDFDLL